ncbi:UDP-N-acetylmuramoyl-L-alanine--D-glutamate ligase [Salisaeta longa]|uniref:UDP-N-acetylmuramoyl-L-alanine--D-glutamate ligase n=1 Tax=Salisaeta longa TaxID=503170 RepID=UPI0003B4B6E0|nr:UDP-N-acetylmuramoyl-L-alanine--D-glutamate ligase [Salisaeta longa]
MTDAAVTVVGGARSGRAAAELLAAAGARVFLTDHGAPAADLPQRLAGAGIAYEFNGHTERALQADFVVTSPGVPTQSPLLQSVLAHGLPLYSEIEVASWFCEAPIVAITGTNGKTTTTHLAGHLCATAFANTDRRVIVAGNVGTPFSDHARAARARDVVILEVSSFQLDHVDTFRPAVSVLLNITPDHLDRYDGSVDAYAAAKLRLFARQSAGDVIVYNHDDARIRPAAVAHADAHGVRRLAFSQEQRRGAGMFVADGQLIVRDEGQETPLLPTDEVSLRGAHNLYNAQAAGLAGYALGLSPAALRAGLTTFEGVRHRLELVRTLGDVQYVNDSKATNVEAVWYALQSFERPIVLIAGGRDKGNAYERLQPLVRDRVRAVVAMGESAATVQEELGAHADACAHATSMDDAVRRSRALAQPGDVVLLSPACSSFDMFENYEDRGQHFRASVRAL